MSVMNSTVNDPLKQSRSASASSHSSGCLADGFTLPPAKLARTSEEEVTDGYLADIDDKKEEEVEATNVTPNKAEHKFIQNNDHDSGNYLPRPTLVKGDIKEDDKFNDDKKEEEVGATKFIDDKKEEKVEVEATKFNDDKKEEEMEATNVTPIKGEHKFSQNNDHDSGNYLPRPTLVKGDIKENDK
jgi:hypothetical protein